MTVDEHFERLFRFEPSRLGGYVDGVVGDPDSTHLERLRFNTLEFPLTILLRTPKDVFKGMRISAAAGPTLIHVISVNQTFQSVVDGFHPYHWVTDNYIRNDIGYQISVGTDIDSRRCTTNEFVL